MPATEFTYFDGLTKYERTRLRRIIRLLHRVYLHSFRSFFLVDLRSAVIRHGYAAGLLPLTAEDWEQLARQPVLRELAAYLPAGEHESFRGQLSALIEQFRTMPIEARQEAHALMEQTFVIYGRAYELSLHFSVMDDDEEDFRWLLASFTFSSHRTDGHLRLYGGGGQSYLKYDARTQQWHERTKHLLDPRERLLLILSMQGFSEDEIADRLCLSRPGIKRIKRDLFARLKTTSLQQSLARAISYHLF